MEYNCSLDCLDCFYLAVNVAPSGALISGIGYGENSAVKVHDGMTCITLSAVREDNQTKDQAVCNVKSCEVDHIIPGFHTQFVIQGTAASPSYHQVVSERVNEFV